jgi:hypothetical protein
MDILSRTLTFAKVKLFKIPRIDVYVHVVIRLYCHNNSSLLAGRWSVPVVGSFSNWGGQLPNYSITYWTLAFFAITGVERFGKSLYITRGQNEIRQTPVT